eukprot:scaffold7889_cov44-Cyclotella_meneghiniana.AAC.2
MCSFQLTSSGDPAIPITDLDFHNDGSASSEDYHWLLDEYNWKASAAVYFMDLEAEITSAHISGFGAMPNCHMRLKNITESMNVYVAQFTLFLIFTIAWTRFQHILTTITNLPMQKLFGQKTLIVV